MRLAPGETVHCWVGHTLPAAWCSLPALWKVGGGLDSLDSCMTVGMALPEKSHADDGLVSGQGKRLRCKSLT
jgi:hypothetical protein